MLPNSIRLIQVPKFNFNLLFSERAFDLTHSLFDILVDLNSKKADLGGFRDAFLSGADTITGSDFNDVLLGGGLIFWSWIMSCFRPSGAGHSPNAGVRTAPRPPTPLRKPTPIIRLI